MKINDVRTYLAVMLLAFTVGGSLAQAGGWISSGGELLENSRNPWFIQNTTEVHYCVQIDAAGISLGREKVELAVSQSIDYWKSELGRFFSLGNSKENFVYQVGTQEFIRQACDGKEDLRFQFGYGTLSEEQIRFLKSPKQYVGACVRTEYDEVLLRGKGFIYIASDQGENRYRDTHSIESPWSKGYLLAHVLTHELGHLFGMPHAGSTTMNLNYVGGNPDLDLSIMSESYPEIILRDSLFGRRAMTSPPQETLFLPQHLVRCNETGDPKFSRISYDYFGISSEYQCIHMDADFRAPKGKMGIRFTASKTETGPRIDLGVLEGSDDPKLFQLQFTPWINLWITPQQKILTLPSVLNDAMGSREMLQIPSAGFYSVEGPAELVITTGTVSRDPRPVLLRLESNWFMLWGFKDGRFELVVK